MALIGLAAVLSVGPGPDDSPAPFATKPLVDMNIEDVGPAVLQGMANNAAGVPAGTARLKQPLATPSHARPHVGESSRARPRLPVS